MADDDDPMTIVIDNGSGMMKAGFAGDDAPSVVFPAVVGVARRRVTGAGAGGQQVFVGDEAMARRGLLALKYPIGQGIVSDWDDMVTLWRYAFDRGLAVSPVGCKVLLTYAPGTPVTDLEKAVQIMSGTFGVSACSLACDAVLALKASGCTSGVVVDVGDGVTFASAVHEGSLVSSSVVQTDIGGRAITRRLQTLLRDEGISAEAESMQDIKEKLCFVSLDPGSEPDDARPFELPGGQIVEIGRARFMAPEILFSQGLQEITSSCIGQCDLDLRQELYSNIVLSGGSTLFPGLAERLTTELTALAPPNAKINVIAPPDRKYSTWIGGSILAAARHHSGLKDLHLATRCRFQSPVKWQRIAGPILLLSAEGPPFCRWLVV
jgi:actin